MTYLEKFEAEFIKKVDGDQSLESIAKWVAGKLLESYKNGITVGQKGEMVRKPKKDSPSKAQ